MKCPRLTHLLSFASLFLKLQKVVVGINKLTKMGKSIDPATHWQHLAQLFSVSLDTVWTLKNKLDEAFVASEPHVALNTSLLFWVVRKKQPVFQIIYIQRFKLILILMLILYHYLCACEPSVRPSQKSKLHLKANKSPQENAPSDHLNRVSKSLSCGPFWNLHFCYALAERKVNIQY